MHSPCDNDTPKGTDVTKRQNIVFFLPSVTPWWFNHIILPQVQAFAQILDVHVIVPSFWRGTGISMPQAQFCGNIPNCNVLYLNDEHHRHIRYGIEAYPDISDLINKLDPFVVLCRAPYTNLPKVFDAKVRYILETSIPLSTKFQTGLGRISSCFTYSDSRMFDFGYTPPLHDSEKSWLENFAREAFTGFTPYVNHATAKTDLGLNPDHKYVLFPLQFALQENLVLSHDRFENNADALDHLIELLPEDYRVIGTNHPLNDLHQDIDELGAMANRHGKRFAPIRAETAGQSITSKAMYAASGIFVQNSKVIYEAAYQNIPILRSSKFDTADWINCTYDEAEFIQRLKTAPLSRNGSKDFYVWLGYHMISEVIVINGQGLNPLTLVEHLTQWCNTATWQKTRQNLEALCGGASATEKTKREALGSEA